MNSSRRCQWAASLLALLPGFVLAAEVCCNIPAGVPVWTDGRPVADVVEDCEIDALDVAEWARTASGPAADCVEPVAPADVNEDCHTDLADLAVVQGSMTGSLPPCADSICDGAPCGPSGGFTVATFPTIAGVDFSAMPANPPRPYLLLRGRRFWYVAPGGSDNADGTQARPLATPDRAVELAGSGDVILVADGRYAVGADEYAALNLSRPGVTLAAVNPGAVTLIPANTGVAVGIDATADDLIVDGFVLSGFRAYGVSFGRLDSPQRRLVLKNLRIEGASDGIRSVVAPSIPNPTPLIRGLLVQNVLIRNVTGVGFNCGEGPCNDLRLEALRVEMRNAGGDTGSDAVAVEEGDNIIVFNADVSGAAGDGLDFKATRVAVANVVVHDLARNGIKLWRGGDIINALVYNTGADAAIVMDAGGRYRILNSTIAYHALGEEAYVGTAAYDHQSDPGRLDVINSIFYRNTGPLFVSPAFTLDVRYSIFLHSPYGAIEWRDLSVGDAGQGYDGFDDLATAGGGCCNPGIVDPRFTDASIGDFTLASSSPGRNAGTTATEAFPSFDLLGRPRTLGAGPDMGPIEGE